ncbi:MAG: Holliday junction branch migration protein RuvA [Dongiaceae bacterium]
MIAKLTGVIDSKVAESAIIDVSGVGYQLYCSARTLSRMPEAGAAISMFVETHVREDHIHLYGFIDAAEREWFRLLTTVQGVGAKLALAILSVLGPGELTQSIAAQDRTALTRASGVGPKLAARIVVELKDKVGGFTLGPVAAIAAATEASGPVADAVSALVHLGYRRIEAFGAVAEAAKRLGPQAALDALIRAGLKELSA